MRVSGADGEKDLTDVDTSDSAVWLAPCTSHSSLQSIGTSARQHLVDSDDMVGVGSNSEMETFLACNFDEVPRDVRTILILTIFSNSLVGANASGFQGFRAQLLVLV